MLPLSAAMSLLGFALMVLPGGRRRRLLIVVVFMLALAATQVGCGSNGNNLQVGCGSNGNNLQILGTSQQQVPAGGIIVNSGVHPVGVSGLPASLSVIALRS